jgi:transposase
MKRKAKVSHIGMDIHRTFSTVTARDASNQMVWRQRAEHGDREALREQFRGWGQGTPVILESTFGWGWLSDELGGAGLEPHLANSKKVAAWRDARGMAKSNRIDSDLLSELWSQQPRWWEVWLVPPEVREQREWMRYRMALVRSQAAMKHRMHAILHRHGIINEFADLFGVHGRRFLNSLIANADVRLGASGRATLKGYLQLLDHVRRQIAGVTREIHKQLKRTPAGQRLMTLPGIGSILAYTIMAEIGKIERFRSAKHLVAYSLLAPKADDSGFEDHENPKGRRIGRAGRRTLQWAWVEGAHAAIRSGGRFRAIYDRATDGGKRNCGRGCIVVAHELCRLGFVLLDKEVDYTEDPPARPGGRPRSQASRPGTGQPFCPMVVAG